MLDIPPVSDDVVQTAIDNNSITPIVKHNLAAKVRLTRQRNGKGEINILFEEPKKYEVIFV